MIRPRCFGLVLLLLTPMPVFADSVASKVQEGNRRYEQKQYDRALQAYNEALLQEPDRGELIYNLANTFYRQGKYKEAAGELRKVTGNEDRTLRSRGHYNLGNAFFQGNQFQDAAGEYARALDLDPGDRDAKHNLELALRKLEEQKQQQQQKQQPSGQDSGQNQEQQQQQNAEQGSQQQQEQQKQQQQEQSPGQQGEEKQDSGENPTQPRGLSRQDAERILQAMEDKERQELLRQLQKVRQSRTRGRDW